MGLLALIPEILSAVLEVLGLTSAAITVLNFIKNEVPNFAREHTQYGIESQVNTIAVDLADGSYGLNALLVTMGTYKDDILTAVAAAQQATNPVILPTVPPTGYGGGSGATAADVWAYPSAIGAGTANDRLDNASITAAAMGNAQIVLPLGGNPNYGIAGTWWDIYGPNSFTGNPYFPYGNIRSTDSLGAFLERESGYTGWAFGGNGYWSVSQGGGTTFRYVCLISQTAFYAIQADLFAFNPVVIVAPVWPGIASVTLGTPVTLTAATTVTGPLHGVIVSLSAVPPGKPTYTLGAKVATAHIGQVAFEDDNGEMEYPQNLSFAAQVYCPQSMVQASFAVLRCVPGVVGTVTPWLSV